MPSSRELFCIATPRQRFAALGVALGLGTFLSAGFLDVCAQIVAFTLSPSLTHRPTLMGWIECLAFPALAATFYFSFPRPIATKTASSNWDSIPLALLIALAYGLIDQQPGLFFLPKSPEVVLAATWTLMLAPVGEEFLFRGWVFSIAHRLWPNCYATATNPLPLAVWISAIAFSLWHLQNWNPDNSAYVIFQIAYTLPAGLWLGWLRQRSHGLIAPTAAHMGINLASALL